jgi:hypothetical protein
MKTLSSVNPIVRTVIIDAVLLVLLFLTPAITHYLGVSYHYFEPMRVALFLGLLMVNDKRNGYLLAALLPVSSMIVSGMPIPPICALMVIELMLNVFLFHLLTKVTKSAFVGMFAGILVSKIVFRLLKCLVVTNGALQASVVLANWQLQLIMSFALVVGFALLLRLKVKK